MTRYEKGFLAKCAEYGVDESSAKGILKIAAKKIDNRVWEELIDRFVRTGRRWNAPPIRSIYRNGNVTIQSPAASDMFYRVGRASDDVEAADRWLRAHRATKEGILRRILGLGHSREWLKEEGRLERAAEHARDKRRNLQHVFDRLKWNTDYVDLDANGISRTLRLGPEAGYNAVMSNTAKELADATRGGNAGRIQKMMSEFNEGTRGGNLQDPAVRLAMARKALAETVLQKMRSSKPVTFSTVH